MTLLKVLHLKRTKADAVAKTAYQNRFNQVRAKYTRFASRLPGPDQIEINQLLQAATKKAEGDAPGLSMGQRQTLYQDALELANQAAEKLEDAVANLPALGADIFPTQALREKLSDIDEEADNAPQQRKGQSRKQRKARQAEYRARVASRDALLASLDGYQTSVQEIFDTSVTAGTRDAHIKELMNGLDAIIANAQAYESTHRGRAAASREATDALVAAARHEKELLQAVCRDMAKASAQVGQDPKASALYYLALRKGLTVREMVEFKRLGIDPTTQANFNELHKDNIDLDASQVDFGGGNVNTVAKLVYNTGGTPEVRIFKPELEKSAPHGVAQAIGIDFDCPNYGKRNIATRRACERLGLGNLIPRADFVTFQGKVGLAMGLAPGKPLQDDKLSDEEADSYNEQGAIEQYQQERKERLQRGEEVPEWVRGDLKAARVDIRDDKFYRIKKVYTDVPYEDSDPPSISADIQKGMMNLHFLDCITGQVDRHSGNYFVDPATGTVTGIDNDFCFGKEPTTADQYQSEFTGEVKLRGKPPLMDRDLYNQLIGPPELTWNEFSQGLDDLLSAEELQAAQSRFDDMKDHARTLEANGCVVDDWETWTAPDDSGRSAAQFMKDDPGDNYFKRDAAQRDQLISDGLLPQS